MITTPSSRGKNAALLIAGILMIATTLRVTFTGAAPLLDAIRADYGLSTAQTGLLTTLRCWPSRWYPPWLPPLRAAGASNVACLPRCC